MTIHAWLKRLFYDFGPSTTPEIGGITGARLASAGAPGCNGILGGAGGRIPSLEAIGDIDGALIGSATTGGEFGSVGTPMDDAPPDSGGRFTGGGGIIELPPVTVAGFAGALMFTTSGVAAAPGTFTGVLAVGGV